MEAPAAPGASGPPILTLWTAVRLPVEAGSQAAKRYAPEKVLVSLCGNVRERYSPSRSAGDRDP